MRHSSTTHIIYRLLHKISLCFCYSTFMHTRKFNSVHKFPVIWLPTKIFSSEKKNVTISPCTLNVYIFFVRSFLFEKLCRCTGLGEQRMFCSLIKKDNIYLWRVNLHLWRVSFIWTFFQQICVVYFCLKRFLNSVTSTFEWS